MTASNPTQPTVAPIGVELRDIRKSFGSVDAVETLSFSIAPGSFVGLIGPSGCGKTTLLRLIGGLEQPTSGSLSYGNVPSAMAALQAMSFCFQEPRLLPWRTVQGNVELPLELAGVTTSERARRAADAIARVQLSDAADRRPHQLSGGMRMRAALARALVTQPRLLLLDEPFGALDDVTRQELGEVLYALWQQERFTAVLVTHSIAEAAFLSTDCIVFSRRPARIVHQESIALPTHDPDVRTTPAFNAYLRSLGRALRGDRQPDGQTVGGAP